MPSRDGATCRSPAFTPAAYGLLIGAASGLNSTAEAATTPTEVKAAFRQPQTALGAALAGIRERHDGPLLDEDAIDAEVKARRGGVDTLLDSVDDEARAWAEEATQE